MEGGRDPKIGAATEIPTAAAAAFLACTFGLAGCSRAAESSAEVKQAATAAATTAVAAALDRLVG
jgi:hypothetical protein